MPFAYFSTGRKLSLKFARYRGITLVGSVEKYAFQKSDLAEKCRFLSGDMTFGSKQIVAMILTVKFLFQFKCVLFAT